jgi:hypothetical protein
MLLKVGILARLVENWQTSWILDVGTGSPTSIFAQTSFTQTASPTSSENSPKGKVVWKDGAVWELLRNAYTRLRITVLRCASLQQFCAQCRGRYVGPSRSSATAAGNGTLGQNSIELPGLWTLDAAMSKAFQIRESNGCDSAWTH